ncbi:MAG: hypothetical protein IJW60_04935 [Clostridia bacterium]|nr:hypothetical protein [Clostridia bacterium]
MKKSAFISDIIFTFFLVWIVALCLFRHLKIALIPALFLAVLCGALAAAAFAALQQNKRKAFLLSRSDAALKEKLFLHLALLGDNEKTDLFAAALAEEDNATIEKLDSLFLQSEERIYFLSFRFSPVTQDEIATLSRFQTDRQKTLVCSQIEEAALTLCNRLSIDVRTGDYAFRLLKSQNALPEKFLCDEVPKNNRARKLRLCFSRANAKRFLTSGALILFFSLFTPFSYYYLVLGGILLLAALFIRIFGYS